MWLTETWTWITAHSEVNTIAASASAISAIAGLMSAMAAFRAIKRNDKNHAISLANIEKARIQEEEIATARRENERLLKHAVTTMERAYLALRGPSSQVLFPPQSRLNWLTAARLIEEYRLTKSDIGDPNLYRECESHEEHWRHQIYLLLQPLAVQHPDYFRSGSSSEMIQCVSAVIVHSFADWPAGKIDPLSKYPSTSEALEKFGVNPNWFNLVQNLRDF
jgi:hypothetical protein